MKTASSYPQPYIALILKVAGVVLMAGTLLDYLFLALPPNFLDSQWLASLINEWVARGTVPFLGLALLFLGVWFDPATESSKGLRGLAKVGVVLPLILGLLFLVLAPLYFNSSRLTSAAQTRQINQQAAQEEQQLNVTLERQREKVSSIVSNQEQLTQLQQRLDSAKLPPDQQSQLERAKETLEKVKSNPKALDQEVAKARTEGLNQIKEKQAKALSQLQDQMRRDRIHTTGSSLLFAIGYLLIAWIGLGGNKPTVKAKKRR